jgi:hypothetical protein
VISLHPKSYRQLLVALAVANEHCRVYIAA